MALRGTALGLVRIKSEFFLKKKKISVGFKLDYPTLGEI
jgi:hypothetical protein